MKHAVFAILLLTFLLNGLGQSGLDSLLSIKGGAYEYPQSIEIDTTGGVKAYYTIDGSKPNKYAKNYKSTIEVKETKVYRFAFYKNGELLERIYQTYFIGRTYDMAVISISVAHNDFFGFDRGIYVKGCCADTVTPHQGANFWKGWERPCNIEMYEPDNTSAFNQGAGVRIFGGFSKGLPMKSLAILAKKKYGSKKFKYQIFPNKDIDKFNSFILRNSGGDFNNTHFRDALMTDLVEPIDIDIQAYRPAAVYINGQYWGIHNIREKLNEHYLKDNHGVDKDSVDLMKHRSDLQCGNKSNYKSLLKYLGANTFETNEKIWELNAKIDVENYINYNIAEVYSDNGDAGGNIRYWREQKEDARWRWILFDLDLGLGISGKTAYKTNTLDEMTRLSNEKWPNPAWSTFIIRKLLENDSIKDQYINHFADHLNTIFSAENANFKLDSIYNLIDNEMPYHLQRWYSSEKKWNQRVDRMRNFVTHRPFYLRTYLMEKFDLQDTVDISIADFNIEEGQVTLNTLTIEKPFTGKYFNGCSVTLSAFPSDGYEFIGWEGFPGDTIKEEVVEFNPESEMTLTPHFREKKASEAQGGIVLNELSIYQDSTALSEDWLELYNASASQLDLSGWNLTTSDNERFIFPEGSTIGAHSYLVVARYREQFQEVYDLSNDLVVQKSMDFGFSKKKDLIKLYDDNLQIVDSLRYKIKDDFPELKDVDNKSLERENAETLVWKVNPEPTPGFKNKGFKALPKKQETQSKNSIFKFMLIIAGFALVGVALLFYFKKKGQNITAQAEVSSE